MNKVEKIKAEIEKRKDDYMAQATSFEGLGVTERTAYYSTLASNMASLIHYIDSLPDTEKDFGIKSSDLEEAAHSYVDTTIEWFDSEGNPCCYPAFIAGAQWQKANLWKDAQGDDLPEIDKDVIVLVKALSEHEDSLLKVSFAHRPPKYWMGKSISTGEITRYEPKRYDKGGWNQPAVVWWLDVELPKEEE